MASSWSEIAPGHRMPPIDSPPTRGALEAAEATIRLQEQAVRVRSAQDWPSLSVSTTLSHQAFPGDQVPSGEDFHRNWSAEVTLDVPIFSGFRNHGAADRERALLMQATAERDRLREETALEVACARAELTRSQALLSSQRETVRQLLRCRQHLQCPLCGPHVDHPPFGLGELGPSRHAADPALDLLQPLGVEGTPDDDAPVTKPKAEATGG